MEQQAVLCDCSCVTTMNVKSKIIVSSTTNSSFNQPLWKKSFLLARAPMQRPKSVANSTAKAKSLTMTQVLLISFELHSAPPVSEASTTNTVSGAFCVQVSAALCGNQISLRPRSDIVCSMA